MHLIVQDGGIRVDVTTRQCGIRVANSSENELVHSCKLRAN